VCGTPVPPIEGVVEELPMSGGLGTDEDPTPIPSGSGGAGGGSDGSGGGFVEIDDPLENFGQPQAEPTKGCGCALPGRAQSQTAWPLLAALGLVLAAARRRISL
jgi:hypothetical protein